MGGFQHGVLCTWQLPWKAVEKALVGTGWTISHLVSTNRLRNHSPPLVGAPFLDLWAAFSQVGLTTESSLMSGCSWGHESKEIVSKKL